MGLVDKIKNIFTEEVEEEEEIKVEQIKKEVRSVPIESPRVDRVTSTREDYKRDTNDVREEPYVEEKAKTPVFFTDRDFEDLVTPKRAREVVRSEKVEEPKREETPKPYGGNYNTTTIIHKERQIFKPTPIISPVYGVLDKNYHKEDIVDRNENVQKGSQDGLSVDSIRNKAYGTLEDDLEETMVQISPKREVRNDDLDLFDELEEEEEIEEDVSAKIMEQEKNIRELEGITMDLTKELDNLLLQKEKDKKKLTPRRIVPEEDDKEDDFSESDLFNLIDSMYDEGEDE